MSIKTTFIEYIKESNNNNWVESIINYLKNNPHVKIKRSGNNFYDKDPVLPKHYWFWTDDNINGLCNDGLIRKISVEYHNGKYNTIIYKSKVKMSYTPSESEGESPYESPTPIPSRTTDPISITSKCIEEDASLEIIYQAISNVTHPNITKNKMSSQHLDKMQNILKLASNFYQKKDKESLIKIAKKLELICP